MQKGVAEYRAPVPRNRTASPHRHGAPSRGDGTADAPQATRHQRHFALQLHPLSYSCSASRLQREHLPLLRATQRREHDVQDVTCVHGVMDENPVHGFGLPLAHQLITVAWPRANGPKVEDLSVMICGDIGHGAGVLVDIQPNRECVRVMHG
jgi:hypothetical protein